MGHSGEKASLFLPRSPNFRHILSEEKSIPTGKKLNEHGTGGDCDAQSGNLLPNEFTCLLYRLLARSNKQYLHLLAIK